VPGLARADPARAAPERARAQGEGGRHAHLDQIAARARELELDRLAELAQVRERLDRAPDPLLRPAARERVDTRHERAPERPVELAVVGGTRGLEALRRPVV